MSQRIMAQITDEEAEAIDAAVAEGRYPSRAAAVRAGLALLLSDEAPAQVETITGEILPEPVSLPVAQRRDWTPALDIARRAALPVLGTGAAALGTRLLLRRRGQTQRSRRAGPSASASRAGWPTRTELRNVVVVLRRG
jgi:Arc/MetJ-type ribon-helix-helix transcriptional regulator